MQILNLSLMLGAAIYAGLVIFSEPAPETAARPGDVARNAATVDFAAPARPAVPDILYTADGRSLTIAAVIDPVALAHRSDGIALIATDRSEVVIASGSGSIDDPALVEVTGNQVNLRAGPSTADAVLGSMLRGDRAELIASPGNSWVRIRALSTGIEGYMADRFVAPMN
jgi:hypothetical protein